VPSVLYKFRSITLQENLLQEGGKLVLETDIHFVVNDKRPVEGYLKGYEKE
jgi:hypothetical protein